MSLTASRARIRLLFSSLTLVLCGLACAQPELPPDTLWTRADGTTVSEVAAAICQFANQRVGIAGAGYAPGRADRDAYLVLRDADGTLLRSIYVGREAANESATGICPVTDGGLLVVGLTDGAAEAGSDGYAIRLDSAGDTLWTRRYDHSARDEFAAVQQTTDGNFIMAGLTTNGATTDVWIVKIDGEGDTLWTRTFGTAGDEAAASIYTLSDGFIVSGRTRSPGGNTDAYVLRLDVGGNALWSRTYGGSAHDEACAARPTFDGGFAIAGSTESVGAGQSDYFLLKVSSAGDTLWTRPYGTNAWERAAGMQPTADGGYVIAGTAQDVVRGGFDFYLVKISATGNPVWSDFVGGAASEYCYAFDRTRDGGYLATGWTSSFGAGSLDFYTVRFAGFSGVSGVVRDETTSDPIPGAIISAAGASRMAIADELGRYTLTLEPGSYDLLLRGQCVERDTARAVFVFPDSLTALDFAVGIPNGRVMQTSVNMVAPNHQRVSAPVTISNTGTGMLDFGIRSITVDPPGSWLSVTVPAGSINPGAAFEFFVEVLADTADVGVFDYFGYVDVHLNSCPDSVQRVIVNAVVVNAARDAVAALPLAYALAAYPNPFNPSTTLSFSLVRDQEISLKIYDLLGRNVRELANERYSAGTHRLEFSANALPAGIYIARLDGADMQLVQKLLLLK